MTTANDWTPISEDSDPVRRRKREAAVARRVREQRNLRAGLEPEDICPKCCGCEPSVSDDETRHCGCGEGNNWEAAVARTAGVLRDAGFSPDHPDYNNPPPDPARRAFQLIRGGRR